MKSIYTGNITREIEVMTSDKGSKYARIPVAIDSMDDFGRKSPTFVELSVFGERAEQIAQAVSKGDLVKVEVRITNRSAELGYGFNFLCTSLELLRKKEDAKPAPKAKRSKTKKAA